MARPRIGRAIASHIKCNAVCIYTGPLRAAITLDRRSLVAGYYAMECER